MRGEPQVILDFQDICKSTILRINHIINYIFNSGINSCRSKTLKYIALAFLGFSMGWPSSEFHSVHLVVGVFMGWPRNSSLGLAWIKWYKVQSLDRASCACSFVTKSPKYMVEGLNKW